MRVTEMTRTKYAGIAQLAEQLICNQQVVGSSPITSSSYMEEFPSGQRGQTVNLLSFDFGGPNPPSSTNKKVTFVYQDKGDFFE